MATWEDGPEYAPLQPPDQFTMPDVPPLSVAPPPEEPPPAPGERPGFGDPEQPVAALTALDPEADAQGRDPQQPFDVDSGTITEGGHTGGAWGAAHWRPPVGAPVQPGQSAEPGSWGPPSGVAAAAPTGEIAVQSSAPASVGGMPAPGTPGWFGPGPSRQQQQQRPTVWKATQPAVLIALTLSLLWFPAPFTFAIAFGLTARARYARQQLLIAFAVVGGAVLAIATISTLSNYGDFGMWYARMAGWSLVGSLLMLILTLVFTKRELDRRFGDNQAGPPSDPPQNPYPTQ